MGIKWRYVIFIGAIIGLVFLLVTVNGEATINQNQTNNNYNTKDLKMLISDLYQKNIINITYNYSTYDKKRTLSYYQPDKGQGKCLGLNECSKLVSDKIMTKMKMLNILQVTVNNDFVDLQIYNPEVRNSSHYYYYPLGRKNNKTILLSGNNIIVNKQNYLVEDIDDYFLLIHFMQPI